MRHSTKKLYSQLLLLIIILPASCMNLWAKDPETINKKVHIPDDLSTIPKGNDFNDNQSEYSNYRSVQSDNFIVFWAKEYGDDPLKNADTTKQFDVQLALKECERFYNFYVNQLKLVNKGKSVTDKFKAILLVTGGKNSTAYGWGKDSVGVMWTPASRMSKYPYGVLAHELGHAFQYLAECDNGTHFKGPFNEMSAQYLLWQVYPDWMTFENYHLKSYLNKTHYAFLHAQNAYHSPYIIEYWSEKRGLRFYGDMLRAAKKGEDAVMTYKRITLSGQDQFNNEMFDAVRRQVTWDLKRIKHIAKNYTNMHHTLLDEIGNGWYRIPEKSCPQNYGYNAIRLEVPAGQRISMHFRGIDTIKGAGWRYGFVAADKKGSVIYGATHNKPEEKVHFKVPSDTGFLWLVVYGAPTEHTKVKTKDSDNPRWPYQFKLNGTGIYRTENN